MQKHMSELIHWQMFLMISVFFFVNYLPEAIVQRTDTIICFDTSKLDSIVSDFDNHKSRVDKRDLMFLQQINQFSSHALLAIDLTKIELKSQGIDT